MRRAIIAAAIAATTIGFGERAAFAGPCTDDITKFETAVRQSAKIPSAGPTTAQSVGAQLSRQPTPESVKQAEDKAQRMFEAVLARAKTLDQAGDQACKPGTCRRPVDLRDEVGLDATARRWCADRRRARWHPRG